MKHDMSERDLDTRHTILIIVTTIQSNRINSTLCTELCPLSNHLCLATEMSGVCGSQSISLLKELGKRITPTTGGQNTTQHLWEQLSIAIQRGNAASILG